MFKSATAAAVRSTSAALKLPDGTQRRRRVGKVWTKRTRPPAGYLTRAQAEARLAAILAGDDPLVNIAPSHVTFGQACAERLRYLEHDKQRKRSTLSDYRNVIAHDLVPHFGESTPGRLVFDRHEASDCTSRSSPTSSCRARCRPSSARRLVGYHLA